MIPAGTIFPFGGSTVPSGYLLCDGSTVSRTTYSTLFSVIGTTYGPGDGSTSFNLPDLTGGVSPPPAVVLEYLIATEDLPDGTVTSVGLDTDASWFTISGSPVIDSGALTFGLTDGFTANQVLATPDGTAGKIGLRSLTGADLPAPTSITLGGVQSFDAVSHQWINAISTSGLPSATQPAFSDISGTVAASQLPNPTATTKGGVQSFAAVSHQWINSISTSGTPSASQPSFPDISGTVAASQLPNPTASSKGGVQSFAAVSHQWINAISTSGVPSAAQPAFSDISGSIGANQIPTNEKLSSIGTVVDGGGFTLTTGQKGYVYCPFAGTITAATLIADKSGSIAVDVWKSAYSTVPTDADSITASAPPTLSSAQTSQNTTLSGWTTSIAAGDVFGFNIDSVNGIGRIALSLTILRS